MIHKKYLANRVNYIKINKIKLKILIIYKLNTKNVKYKDKIYSNKLYKFKHNFHQLFIKFKTYYNKKQKIII